MFELFQANKLNEVKIFMEIGTKLKNARKEANLSQEQVAETIGVSRQTISNWENEKTFPDIISVIKMSDLYSISLDNLLKEKNQMKQTYTEYLEESTNVVKSKNKLAKLILILSYLTIWAIAIIVFWFFTSGSDALGYGFLFLWVLLPVITFVLSVLIGVNNYWGNLKWLAPIPFGAMYMLAEYATFHAAHMASSGTISFPHFEMILSGGIISIIGIGLGFFFRYLNSKKKGFIK